MKAYNFRGREQWGHTIVQTLWGEYIGQRPDSTLPFLVIVDRLKQSITNCLHAEREAHREGRATAGRVSETHGHAILLGKIRAGV